MIAPAPSAGPVRRLVAHLGPVEWLLLGAFVALAVAVATGAGVQRMDDAILRALPWAHDPGAPPGLPHATYLVVFYASPEASFVATLVVAGLWSWRSGGPAPLRRIAPPVVVGAVAVVVLKAVVHRTGPPSADPVTVLGYFPSGHTAMALLCTGSIAAAVIERRPRLRLPLLAAVGLWTTLIAACLLYHHFHWASDVLGSLLLGVLVLRLRAASRAEGVRPGRPDRAGVS